MDEPVTKAELKTALDALETRITARLDQMVATLREYIDERTHDAETRLLRGFSDYNTASNIRMRKLEADVSNVNESSTKRLGAVEEKLTDIEIRLMRLESGAESK
jgi:hypothetical protein